MKRAVAAAFEARGAAESVAVSSGRAASSGGGISGEALSIAEAGCAHRVAGVAIDAASGRTLEGIHKVRAIDDRIHELTPGKDPSATRLRSTPLFGRDARGGGALRSGR